MISITCIILCHCCFAFDNTVYLGRYLGQTFNFIFLCLSAILLGISFEKKNYSPYKKEFLIHRLKRLSATYYPFLIMMFVFLTVTNQTYHVKDIIMHILYLPWFDKLPGFGHLWFLTMIVFCYFGIYYYSKYQNYPPRFVNIFQFNSFKFIMLSIILIIIAAIINKFNLPGQFILYFGYYIFIFSNANNILTQIQKIKYTHIIISTLLINALIISCYYCLNLYDYENISYLTGIICASSIFTLLAKIFYHKSENKYISFISKISFEIYLVHHVLAFGKYSIYNLLHVNFIVGFLIVTFISIILGYLLHYISNSIMNLNK